MTLDYTLKVNKTQYSISKPKLCSPEMLELPVWVPQECPQKEQLLGGEVQERFMWCAPTSGWGRLSWPHLLVGKDPFIWEHLQTISVSPKHISELFREGRMVESQSFCRVHTVFYIYSSTSYVFNKVGLHITFSFRVSKDLQALWDPEDHQEILYV